MLIMAIITGIRLTLYKELRKGLLGLYLSAIIYDVILLPGIIAAMLRWYFLTISVLRAGDREQRQQREQQEREQRGEANLADTGEHVVVDMAGVAARENVLDRTSVSSSVSSAQGSTRPRLSHRSEGNEDSRAQRIQRRKSSFHFSSWWPSINGPSGCKESQSRSHVVSGDSGNVSQTFRPPRADSLSPPSNFADGQTISRVPMEVEPVPTATLHEMGATRRERVRNSSTIRRLLRISLTVACLWTCIAVVDILIWVRFYLGENTIRMKTPFLIRMVLMRAVGAVDAVILGDLFILCLPCARILSRVVNRLRRSDLSYVPGGRASVGNVAGPSSVMSVSKMRASMVGDGGRGLLKNANMLQKEEEASRTERKLDAINSVRAPNRQMKNVDFFATTWNMGGVDLEALEAGHFREALLPQWLPPDFSLYVLGVQECQCLRQFRADVHSHLGGPEAFVMFGDELGDDQFLHGFIAITLFVRADDVATGAFHLHKGAVNKVAAGVSLGALGHAPNKGMVGLSCRYYDVSLAFVTAHFASDSKGRNRVSKRNQHARTTLQALSLHNDSDDFEVHHQHHHQICLGDFNYRLSPATPTEVLQLVARSAQISQEIIANEASESNANPTSENWRKLSYKHFFERPTGLTFSLGSIPELPPCLGTRCSSSSSQNVSQPSYGTSGLGWPNSTSSKSYLGGKLPHLFLARSGSNAAKDESNRPPEAHGLGAGFSNVLRRRPSMELYLSSPLSRFGRQGSSNPVYGIGSLTDGEGPQQQISVAGSGSPSLRKNVKPSIVNSSSTRSIEDLGVDVAWNWVGSFDELSRSMRGRVVFYNFTEAPITFPPSYRWNRSIHGFDLAGDYTDVEQLMHAYSTFVADHPKLISRLTKSFVSHNERGNGTVSPLSTLPRSLSSSKKRKGVSLRIPSYTDRILIHSMPGKGANLRWRHYDMMDAVPLSDHRPVCAHFTLFVDANCRGFQTFSTPPHSVVPPDDKFSRVDEPLAMQTANKKELALFTIVLSHPHVTLKGGSNILSNLSAATIPHEATILFPLVSEDPLAAERLASSLGEVIPGGTSHEQSSFSSLSHHEWSSFPVRLKTLASPRFSEHLLLKVSNDRGKEIGQTIIPLALGISSKEVPQETHLYPSSYANSSLCSFRVDEIVQGLHGKEDNRRFSLPLTKGGSLRGWITLTLRTKIKPIRQQHRSQP